MKILDFKNKKFFYKLNQHVLDRNNNNNKVEKSVKKILAQVANDGDKALIKFTKDFDNINLSINELAISSNYLHSYKKKINPKIFNSFKKSIKNVRNFHKLQVPKNYILSQKGIVLKCIWKPLDSVGLYIPGGNAFYPSSLIMNVVPAIVAGVKRIVCVTPPSTSINPYILALFDELKIHEVYQIGGAQAIAALTFGTKTIKPVNKIFGPGNSFVTEAKKQVYGKVGIDLIAGPSEIIVVADKNNNPNWVACDLMAQAEHDENSLSILITNSNNFANIVLEKINLLSADLPKKNIIKKSLKNNGLIILIDNIKKSSEIINYVAPEHLHVHVDKKEKITEAVNNAGCIFVGEYASEAFGDYIIGTNHILPTSGSAKFSSGLGVLDFMKRNSIAEINKSGYKKFQKDVQQMAETEDLEAHKLSVKIRQNK